MFDGTASGNARVTLPDSNARLLGRWRPEQSGIWSRATRRCGGAAWPLRDPCGANVRLSGGPYGDLNDLRQPIGRTSQGDGENVTRDCRSSHASVQHSRLFAKRPRQVLRKDVPMSHPCRRCGLRTPAFSSAASRPGRLLPRLPVADQCRLPRSPFRCPALYPRNSPAEALRSVSLDTVPPLAKYQFHCFRKFCDL